MQPYNVPRPVYTKDLKDIPDRLWRHEWLRTIDFNKLPKYQLKVRMCCPKCEEKVLEEIWEVHGVVDVIAYRADKKVVVTGMPERPEAGFDSRFEGRDGFLNTDEVLRKAKKIDCRAKFVKLDVPVPVPVITTPKPPKPPAPPKPDQPTGTGHITHVVYPGSSTAPYTQGPPHIFIRDPAQDDNTPFYFLLFVILLLSLLIFRK
ncbi:hypothetical protein M758_11G033800 [Ceratodon purpureus]|uniref:HMA domain-containing protein n=1 Tax=Ceratodon purpureus TaxID=3225 RepID=A0A8T0GBV0_CERPU|nr:hypothetical protein KC19_11G034800 [Ceratodon purpureus]KAG0600432.1 hypothetical protein M758_11G033800 [Ceratodon purpureus]